MKTLAFRSLASLVTMIALVGVLVVPLCGGLAAAHLCPMEMTAAASHGADPDRGCQGPAGPGLKRQPMDCCIAPQADASPALQSGKLQVSAPQPWQPSVVAAASPMIHRGAALQRSAPRQLDRLSLHSSLLL